MSGGGPPAMIPAEMNAILSFAAALAVARARRGLLTTKEIREALDEAFRKGQQSVAAVVDHELRLGASPEQLARRVRAAVGDR